MRYDRLSSGIKYFVCLICYDILGFFVDVNYSIMLI